MDIEAAYREHAPALLAFLRARVPAAIATDILHDVFVTLLEFPGTLAQGELRRWLIAVARNRAIDYLRKASTRWEKAEPAPDRQDVANRSGLDAAIASERMARLRACIEKLPEDLRVVVQARLGGESSEETAGRLGVPRATIDRRFHRAKEQLAECPGAEPS